MGRLASKRCEPTHIPRIFPKRGMERVGVREPIGSLLRSSNRDRLAAQRRLQASLAATAVSVSTSRFLLGRFQARRGIHRVAICRAVELGSDADATDDSVTALDADLRAAEAKRHGLRGPAIRFNPCPDGNGAGG
jgi:hypothetical protein